MRPDLLRNGLRSRPVLPKLSKTRVPGSGVLGRPSLRRTATITHGTGTACVRVGPSRLVSTADSTRPSPAPPTRARPVTKRRNCSSRGTKYFLTGEKSAQNPLWRNLVKKNQNRTADIKIRARPETKKIRRVGIKSPGKIQTFQKFEPHKS